MLVVDWGRASHSGWEGPLQRGGKLQVRGLQGAQTMSMSMSVWMWSVCMRDVCRSMVECVTICRDGSALIVCVYCVLCKRKERQRLRRSTGRACLSQPIIQ